MWAFCLHNASTSPFILYVLHVPHTWHRIIPQTDLSVGVLAVLIGPMKGGAIRWCCRRAIFLVIYTTWWHLPSKTHRKIDILKEFLHSAAEGYQLIEIWASWSLLRASSACYPPNATQMVSKWLPKWLPEGLPDAILFYTILYYTLLYYTIQSPSASPPPCHPHSAMTFQRWLMSQACLRRSKIV